MGHGASGYSTMHLKAVRKEGANEVGMVHPETD